MKKWFGPLLIVITLAIVLIAGIVQGVFVDALKAVLHANPLYMLMCALCFLAYVCCNAAAVRSFIKREGYELSMKDSVLASFTSVYYSDITPGATGGQPMQIYHLNKLGIPVEIGTSAVASFLIAWHVIRIVMITVLGFFYWDFIMENLSTYWIFLLLGYTYNLMIVALWLLFCFSKKPIELIVRAIAKVADVFHLSRDPEEMLAKMIRTADKFHTSMQHLKNHKNEIARQLFFGFLHMVLLISILYFAYRGVGLNGAGYLELMVMALCQYVSAAYMPTPGASGAQEGIFGLFFGRLIPGSKLFAVMMIWRFMSYYFGLILGAVINLIGRRSGNGVTMDDRERDVK